MADCKSCIHESACAAWIRHGKTLWDDFEFSTEDCPYHASRVEVTPACWKWGHSLSGFGIFCSNCGAGWSDDDTCRLIGLAENHKYCPKCGKPIIFEGEGDWEAQNEN